MLSVLTYSNGRTLKRPVEAEKFMPRYIEDTSLPVNKSLERQQQEFAAFAAKLKAIGQRK